MGKDVFLLCMFGFEDSYIHQTLYGVFDSAEDLIRAYMELNENDVRVSGGKYDLCVYKVPLGEFIYYKEVSKEKGTLYEDDIDGTCRVSIKDVADIFCRELAEKYGDYFLNSKELADFEMRVLKEFGFWDTVWKPLSLLREVNNNLSGKSYSGEFAIKNKNYRRSYGEGRSGSALTYKEIAEPVEIRTTPTNELEYRILYEPKTFPQQPAEFKTKYGNFITNNQGEFGGDMTLPNGKTIGGNYAYVFECGEYVYAVSTLSHFTISDFDLVCFDKDLNEKTIYSAHSSGSLYSLIMDDLEGEKETYECLYYVANYIYEDILYVVVSGYNEYSGCGEQSRNSEPITKILVIKDGNPVRTISFPLTCHRINNLIISKNIAYVSMDKMVVVIDLEKETFKLLTVVNLDAEKDLLRKE